MTDVETALRRIVSLWSGFEEDQITDKSTFSDDLDMIDSLDQVELVIAIEEEFDITISDDEAETLLTFGQAVRFVEARIVDQRGAA